uniref:CCHC-type domain-containing protein n=1 Tax=Globisporangium ultimum (strain ATCC 200006 / CBS 805.95 / DAOM BR144) TaxID=431595 RepID=K3X5T4_GLOUD
MDKITNYMRVTKTRKTLVDSKKMSALASPLRTTRSVNQKTPTPARTSTWSGKLQPEEEEDSKALRDADGGHVPEFIYQVVKYKRKGQSGKLSTEVAKVVKYIQAHYKIPADFERKHKFGPHSGLTYETRLVQAYSHKLLELNNPKANPVPQTICINCAQLGHPHKECPDGF